MIPTIQPPALQSRKPSMIGQWLYRGPLRRFRTNPVYRFPLVVILVLLSLLGLFQLGLIVGLPWGRAAWGGQAEVLPTALRFGSVSSILIYCFMLKVAIDRASQDHHRVFRRRTHFFIWFFTLYLSLGVILNVLSSSPWEKFLMAPVALALAISFGRLAPRPKLTDEMVHVNS